MKVTSLSVEDFSAFQKAELEFSPGLNVFIGENATGKSHLMKLMYSILTVLEEKAKQLPSLAHPFELRKKLEGVFMPDGNKIERLIRRARGCRRSEIRLTVGTCESKVSLLASTALTFEWSDRIPSKRSIFIPSREALAMFDGFIAAYKDRELSFDETYYDLCVALSAKPLRGKRAEGISSLLEPLKDILGGRVVLEGGRFHVHAKGGPIEAHLLAEGFRKIASLAHLIANGSLMKNGFLFWDEPEANLNPKLITKVAETLQKLAKAGVQVFIATHDYLLSHELSLAVEYASRSSVPTRFFAFSRKNGKPVEIEAGETLAELTHNPILEEFAAHYDREQSLFERSVNKKERK